MASYLVTGGAGFIGSNIVSALVKRGDCVRVLDNFSTGRRENLADDLAEIELIEGDLRDLAVVRRAVQGVDYVLHQGALPSVPRSVTDPLTTHEVNATGTLNVLLAARDANAKKVVYASSSSVYGNNPSLPKQEDMSPDPLSPYAVAKLAGEGYCKAFYRVYDLETVIFRYFNVFGPRQDPTSEYAAVIPKFTKAILRNESPTIHGDGTQSRDFTYVDNVVAANLKAVAQPGLGGWLFNIACSRAFTLLELVDSLNQILGKDIKPIFREGRVGDVKHSLASIASAKDAFGYEPTISFSEGLGLTVECLRRSTTA
jgi:nucleoside-diphosphate-sugar epimerase